MHLRDVDEVLRVEPRLGGGNGQVGPRRAVVDLRGVRAIDRDEVSPGLVRDVRVLPAVVGEARLHHVGHVVGTARRDVDEIAVGAAKIFCEPSEALYLIIVSTTAPPGML